jgi:hypothetical protein
VPPVGLIPVDELIGVGKRSPARVIALAIIETADASVVSVVAVGAEKGEGAALIADVGAGVHAIDCRAADVEAAADAQVGLRLENDVDDARHSFGIVFGRRIRHDLNPLDDVGGNLLEICGELRAGDWRGPSVDLNRHVLVAAQADFPVSIDFHRRRCLQHFARVCSSGCDIFGAVAVAIGLDHHRP